MTGLIERRPWRWLVPLLPVATLAGWWLGGPGGEVLWRGAEPARPTRSVGGMVFVRCGDTWIGRNEVAWRDLRGWTESDEPAAWPAALSVVRAREAATWLGENHAGEFRLPTPEEWERAARAGLHGQPWPWGRRPPDGDAVFDRDGPVPVDEGRLYGGLRHAAGNVAEWCADGSLRGGSWAERDADQLRIDRVFHPAPGYEDRDVGFRLVWVSDQ